MSAWIRDGKLVPYLQIDMILSMECSFDHDFEGWVGGIQAWLLRPNHLRRVFSGFPEPCCLCL
jgi:hypothetical protein